MKAPAESPETEIAEVFTLQTGRSSFGTVRNRQISLCSYKLDRNRGSGRNPYGKKEAKKGHTSQYKEQNHLPTFLSEKFGGNVRCNSTTCNVFM
jgi:hypothetical protein